MTAFLAGSYLTGLALTALRTDGGLGNKLLTGAIWPAFVPWALTIRGDA